MSKRDKVQHKIPPNGRQEYQSVDGGVTSQHDEIAARAYELWQRRGCPIGSPDEDWSQAEAELQVHEQPHVKVLTSAS